MAVLPQPAGCVRQPTESLGMNESGVTSFAVIYKGAFSTLEDYAKVHVTVGAEVDTGLFARSWQLDRAPGDCGVLTINCLPSSTVEAEGGSLAKCLEDLWELRSARNDISIFAYCGDSAGQPSRPRIEAWMKEPDGILAAGFEFRDSAGQEQSLLAEDIAIAKKIVHGKEAVVRFYAVLSRSRTYDNCPPKCLEHLAEIDTPPFSTGNARAPNGLSDAISAHSWLKIQDDALQQPDKTWKRIESWWGIPYADSSSGWDTDFYGPNRWKMPYNGTNA